MNLPYFSPAPGTISRGGSRVSFNFRYNRSTSSSGICTLNSRTADSDMVLWQQTDRGQREALLQWSSVWRSFLRSFPGKKIPHLRLCNYGLHCFYSSRYHLGSYHPLCYALLYGRRNLDSTTTSCTFQLPDSVWPESARFRKQGEKLDFI